MFKEYTVGQKAFIDSINGMVPCTVLEIPRPCDGRLITNSHTVLVKITATLGNGYTKGEVLHVAGYRVIPVSHRITRNGMYFVNTWFRWVPKAEPKDDTIIGRIVRVIYDDRRKGTMGTIVSQGKALGSDVCLIEFGFEDQAYYRFTEFELMP